MKRIYWFLLSHLNLATFYSVTIHQYGLFGLITANNHQHVKANSNYQYVYFISVVPTYLRL